MTATPVNMILYLQGELSEDGKSIQCPLLTSVILFVIQYCQSKNFELVFISDCATTTNTCCTLNRRILLDLSITFTSWADVPQLIKNVSLPSLHQPELSLIRSGLCVLLRHIIKESHLSQPDLHLIDLLGFRQGSMKMCAEVSGFTNLCEVELPESITHLICVLKVFSLHRKDKDSNTEHKKIVLPSALIKLNNHFMKKCRVHNDNKRRREELIKLQKFFRAQTLLSEDKSAKDVNIETEDTSLEECGVSSQSNQFQLDGSFINSERDQSLHDHSFLCSEKVQLFSTGSKISLENNQSVNSDHFISSKNDQLQPDSSTITLETDQSVREGNSVISENNQSQSSTSYFSLETDQSFQMGSLIASEYSQSIGKNVNSLENDQSSIFISFDTDQSQPGTNYVSLQCDQSMTDDSFSSELDPLRKDNFIPIKHSARIDSDNESFRIDVEQLTYKDSQLRIDHTAYLNHGIRRLIVDKKFDIPLHLKNKNFMNGFGKVKHSGITDNSAAEKIAELVEKLTYIEIEYEHTYSEGIEMTLADLILYVYVYHLLEALDFSCISLADHIPRILQWASHMTSLDTIISAGQRSGWDLERLSMYLSIRTDDEKSPQQNKDVAFFKDDENLENDDDEMELSRCARMKHKALKPEVAQILQKVEKANIKPVIGSHCCRDKVELDWDKLHVGAHPKEGGVPESRTRRKCQQLENLVTAVQLLANDGDVLVDFCSGGGHIGILMAHLLPECQVYLVENKEESLLKACSRLKSLNLRNVTMYQCNLDYFVGTFQVGVSLHACGSATDMVLQLCLNSLASFVICPCCYGSIQKTHLLSYPQSKLFTQAGITYKDFQTLGHAADQTEFNIALEEQGRLCMHLVDTDRAELARENGYHVTLCSLKPLSCTPKNNLLIGTLVRETELKR